MTETMTYIYGSLFGLFLFSWIKNNIWRLRKCAGCGTIMLNTKNKVEDLRLRKIYHFDCYVKERDEHD